MSRGEGQEHLQAPTAKAAVGNCMDEATCREAEGSPREDGQSTGRGPKGDGTMDVFQVLAGSDLRSKETVPAEFCHTQGKG